MNYRNSIERFFSLKLLLKHLSLFSSVTRQVIQRNSRELLQRMGITSNYWNHIQIRTNYW